MNQGRATDRTDELESLRCEVRALAAIVAAGHLNAGMVSPARKRQHHHQQLGGCTCAAAQKEVAAALCRASGTDLAPAASVGSGPRAENVVDNVENQREGKCPIVFLVCTVRSLHVL